MDLFITACTEGDLEKVKNILENYLFEVDDEYEHEYVNFEEFNLGLRNACLNNHMDIVDYLIKSNLNSRNYALRVCCIKGYFENFKHIIDTYGYECDFDCDLFEDCLYSAVNSNNFELVKYIISFGVDIKKLAQTLFNYTGLHGNVEMAKFFVSFGANDVDSYSRTLCDACTHDHIEMVEYLLSIGADASFDGYNALYYANFYKNLEVIYILVKKGNVPYELVSEKAKRSILFRDKMQEKTRNTAAKKIYFWIIPKLYSPNSESAYRLGLKGYEASIQGRLL